MKRLTHQFAIVALAGLLVVFTATAAESLSVLLQKGIFAEETEGNLDAAIKIYEGIVKEGEANRSLVAQAQYRLGMCRLKQGKQEEAVTAFRKLIDQFSDAAELVARSRERLEELGQPASTVVVRQVWAGPEAAGDSISPDGRYLAFIDWNTGNLAVRDLTTGQNRRVTQHGSWEAPVQYAESCVFSRDGKHIAYSWFGTNSSDGLHVVDVEGGRSRLLVAPQTNRWWSAEDWSPDGKWIAAQYSEKEGTNWHGAIALVNVADGTSRKVMAGHDHSDTLRFSPDGQYLACNVAKRGFRGPDGQRTNDIYVVNVQTGISKLAVQFKANEQLIGWAPRSSEILFTSERRETTDLWVIEVDVGEPKGTPKLLRANLGDIKPVGIAHSGALFYRSDVGGWTDLYLTAVDFQGGRVLSVSKLLRTLFLPQMNYSIHLSTDGKLLFFRSGIKEPFAQVLDIQTGEQKEIPGSRAWAGRLSWWWAWPDNVTLLVRLLGGPNEGGFYRLNAENGTITPLAVHGPGVDQGEHFYTINPYYDENVLAYGRRYSREGKLVLVKHDFKLGRETEYEIPGMPRDRIPLNRNRHVLLPDGRTFLFNRKSSAGGSYALIKHDLMTGEQKEFFFSKSPIGVVTALGLPSDHSKRVFIVTNDERSRSVFRLFSFDNSELRQIGQVTVPEGFEYRGQDWTEPHLILIRKEDDVRGKFAERWTLSVRTGELKNIGFSAPSEQFLGLPARGGRPFVFPVSRPGSREIWVMENFLPPVAVNK